MYLGALKVIFKGLKVSYYGHLGYYYMGCCVATHSTTFSHHLHPLKLSPHDTIHPLNITNIDLIPATPPHYLLTPVNIYEFLSPPLISANPHYPLLIPTAPLISTNSDNLRPISDNPHSPWLIPANPISPH